MELFQFKSKHDFLLLTKEISNIIESDEKMVQVKMLKNRNVNHIDELFAGETLTDFIFEDQTKEMNKQSILKERTILWIDNDAIHFEIPYYSKYNERLIRENISDLLTKDSSLFRKTDAFPLKEVDDHIIIRGFIDFKTLRESYINTEDIINNINDIYNESGLSLLIDSFMIRYNQDGTVQLKEKDYQKYRTIFGDFSKEYIEDIYEFFIESVETIPNLNSQNFTKYYLSAFI